LAFITQTFPQLTSVIQLQGTTGEHWCQRGNYHRKQRENADYSFSVNPFCSNATLSSKFNAKILELYSFRAQLVVTKGEIIMKGKGKMLTLHFLAFES
jgi:hypothetical protein